jgi:hypothetical protein
MTDHLNAALRAVENIAPQDNTPADAADTSAAIKWADVILNAAGSSLRNYTPQSKAKIVAAVTQTLEAGRTRGLESTAQAIGQLQNRSPYLLY